jgi:hypothetical protein
MRRWYREDGTSAPGINPMGSETPCFMRPARSFILEGKVEWCETYGALVVANGEAWTMSLTEVPQPVLDAFQREMEAEVTKP